MRGSTMQMSQQTARPIFHSEVAKRSRQHFQASGAELTLTTRQQTVEKEKEPTCSSGCCLPAKLQESSRTSRSSCCSSSIVFPPITRLSRPPAARTTGNTAHATPPSPTPPSSPPFLWTSGRSKYYFQPGIFRRRLGLPQEAHTNTHTCTSARHHSTTKWQVELEVLVQSADGCEGFFLLFFSFFSVFFILEKQVEDLQWHWPLCFPAIRPVQVCVCPPKALPSAQEANFHWVKKRLFVFFHTSLEFSQARKVNSCYTKWCWYVDDVTSTHIHLQWLRGYLFTCGNIPPNGTSPSKSNV